MFRKSVALACVFLMIQTIAAPAFAASQTTKIKTKKGLKSGLQIVVNPNTGNVLIVFEEKGAIFATLAKSKGGKYKTKKAKKISGKEAAYRPHAVWDERGGEFRVAWDTGPADLVEAGANGVNLDSADIQSRRVKAKKGKPNGGVIDLISDGKTNLSPLLYRDTDNAVHLFFVSHDPSSRVSEERLVPYEVLVAADILEFLGADVDKLFETEEGIAELKFFAEAVGAVCLAFAVHGSEGGTAFAAAVFTGSLFSGLAFSGPTPTVFGFVNTLPAFILFLTAGKLFGWIEPPRLRMEAAAAAGSTDRPTFYEGLDGDGNPRTSVKFADAAGTSNAVGAEPPEGSRIPETAFIVTETTENMTRLRELDGDGELVAETDLFPNKRDMGDQRLVMLPGGTTAMLVWVKEKSAKKQEVWLHFFDLP